MYEAYTLCPQVAHQQAPKTAVRIMSTQKERRAATNALKDLITKQAIGMLWLDHFKGIKMSGPDKEWVLMVLYWVGDASFYPNADHLEDLFQLSLGPKY